MKTTVAVILLLLANVCSAVEIQTSATGNTCDDAVQNAKAIALARVTGEFVVSKAGLNGDTYDEHTTQYSGGVVRSYKELNVVQGNNRCVVTILANVDPNKDNRVIVDSDVNVPDSARQALVEHQQRTDNINRMSNRLDNAGDAFAVVPGQIKYVPRGNQTDVLVTVGVRLSPKWIDDVKVFSREAGKKINTDTPISDILWGASAIATPFSLIGGSVIRSAASAMQPKQQVDVESNCFSVDNTRDVDECYALGRMFYSTVQYDRFKIEMRLWSGNRVVESLPLVVVNNNRLFVTYDIGTSLYFTRSAKERKFASRGVLWFTNGLATAAYRHVVNTDTLSMVDRVDFVLR